MPPDRNKAAPHSDRKPYVRFYRPFTMRLERPPLRTPSPTEFVSSMRKEYDLSSFGPRFDAALPPSEVANVTTQPKLALATQGLNPSVPATSTQAPPGPSGGLSSEGLLQAPPDRVFDPSVKKKIKQPKGGIGKPNSGGYSLSAVLESHGWSTDQYDEVLKEVRAMTVIHLDTTKSFQNQKQDSVATFIQEARGLNFYRCLSLIVPQVVKAFPGLEYYESEWPARNFAYQYLRNRPKPAEQSVE